MLLNVISFLNDIFHQIPLSEFKKNQLNGEHNIKILENISNSNI